MKPNEIKAASQPRQSREVGDAPHIGRVARFRYPSADPAPRSLRVRKSARSSRTNRWVGLWSAALGLVAVVLILLTIFFWARKHIGQDQLQVVPKPIQKRVASKFPSPDRDQAIELARRALTSKDDQLLKSLFRADGTSGAEILDFLNGVEKQDGPIDRYEWLSSLDSNGMLIEGVLVIYKGKEKPVERMVLLTPDPAGNWMIDFDAFAQICKPPLSDFLTSEVEYAIVRVFAGKDVYYNGVFGDESQWVSYGLLSSNEERIMRGYCRVGSKQAEAMAILFSEGQEARRVTLELRRLKGSAPLQFEITRVVSDDWIVAKPAEAF